VRARLPSKRQLEVQLGKLRILQTPVLRLEQYPVSPEVAGELLYMSGFEHNDLDGRVIDLGTGTGRLAIGSALMGSREVVGVDVDEKALALARENAETVNAKVQWLLSNISEVHGRFDAVVMNPPYGTRTSHADAKFLEKAFQLAPIVYSIHKASTRDFLLRYVKNHDWKVEEARNMNMKIPHLFSFHQKKWQSVDVDLYRIVS
jgi:putative methylase